MKRAKPGASSPPSAKDHADTDHPIAYILGGETVVHLTGHGKGGRNQELALAAAEGIAGLSNVAVFSVGSDGTDGPTDAAGGYVDGATKAALDAQGIFIADVLADNDALSCAQTHGRPDFHRADRHKRQ